MMSRLERPLLLWFCSFGVVASILIFHFHMSLQPILIAGFLTFVITVARALSRSNLKR